MKPLNFNYGELYELFPEMTHYDYNGRKARTSFGFGDGWYPIVKSALTLIDLHVRTNNEQRLRAIEIHKAFNELRFDDLPAYMRAKAAAGDASFLPVIPEKKQLPQFMQIKEKFGGLRMYMSGGNGDPYFSAIINMAEAMASHTCEVTGDYGKLMIQNRSLYRVVSEAYAESTGGWEEVK